MAGDDFAAAAGFAGDFAGDFGAAFAADDEDEEDEEEEEEEPVDLRDAKSENIAGFFSSFDGFDCSAGFALDSLSICIGVTADEEEELLLLLDSGFESVAGAAEEEEEESELESSICIGVGLAAAGSFFNFSAGFVDFCNRKQIAIISNQTVFKHTGEKKLAMPPDFAGGFATGAAETSWMTKSGSLEEC